MRSLPLGFASIAVLALAGAAARAAPNPMVITGDPVAPSPQVMGTGLCGTSAISMMPANDFAQSTATYNASVNAFIEMHSGDRVTTVLRTIFDLSNNNISGLKASFGDFINSMMGTCQVGGCDFAWNDVMTSFATRFRGFLNVTDSFVGKPVHFGFYADDAVSFTIFDKNQNAYPIITRPPVLGAATWRSTNQVTFNKSGLYPIEINYVEIVEHAALEMSFLNASFNDFESPANLMPTNLNTAGFTLFTPIQFFQTDDGQPSFPDLAQCAQCNRQFANLPGNGGCMPGMYCNEAALCAPCNSALFCGATCSPCGGATPFCVNVNQNNVCVGCRNDRDCKTGLHCDPMKHECQDCNVDQDCDRGKVCDAHKCVPCSTWDHCAGASCNCCPGGMKMKCAPLTENGPPVCVECLSDKDCPGNRCDPVNGHCIDTVPPCNTSDKCGAQCMRCPSERPLCLDGQVCVTCRADTDCGSGEFCLSGECAPCAVDRHCGNRCASCGGDAPLCFSSDGTAAHSGCVRCLSDADCAGGGRCSLSTHNCETNCPISCAAGTFCNGARCVACYANTQCPCGGSCDVPSGECTASCTNSTDCNSGSHCSEIDSTCQRGRRKPNTQPKGGGFCSCLPRVAGRAPEGDRDGGPGALLALAFLAVPLLSARRRRARARR